MLLFVISAVVGEKSLEIYLEASRFGLFKANCLEQRLVLDLTRVNSIMNTRKVDKIESSSAHNEQGFKIVKILCRSDIVNQAALVGQLEIGRAHV